MHAIEVKCFTCSQHSNSKDESLMRFEPKPAKANGFLTRKSLRMGYAFWF
jgi:hypothetical protein